MDRATGDYIERVGRFYASETAVVHGDRRMSYAEMLSGVRRAGRALLGLGLERGDRVAMLMGDCADLVPAYYGVLWAGLAVVPLNARLSEDDHAYSLEDSGARVLLHDAAHAEEAANLKERTPVEHVLDLDDLAALTKNEPDGAGGPSVTADDLYGIYYTGGTTGRPKGVAHSHRTFLAAMASEMIEMGLGERDVFAHVAPLTHASGGFLLPVLLRGGTNVVLGGFDPEQLLATIARERVTATLMVPTMIYVLLDHPALDGADTSSLQTLIYGAAPMGRERLVQAIERLGPITTQLYGQTEAPNQICVLRRSDHADAVNSGDLEPLSSCGRPVTFCDVRLVDDDLNEVPQGETGEIAARGPHVMLGYWNRPEETEETLRDGWLCTGDLARADERGFVYIVDRKKDMIVSGGFNVYPKEVEQALFAHPAVKDACVIGVPDEKWGEAVKAVVVAEGVEDAELITWVKQRKGSVMAPKSVDFVAEIPLTAVGKHDKPSLRKTYWSGRERAVN